MDKNLIELQIAKDELAFQNQEKQNRAAELVLANIELAFQNIEKENRAAELAIANQKLIFQNQEKESRAAELVLAQLELAFQNVEKKNRANELAIANEELAFQNQEKQNRAAELVLAKLELAFQNQEKANRAAELVLAKIELAFQKVEKETRAIELAVAQKEIAYQKLEKENRFSEFRAISNKFNLSQDLLQDNLKEVSDYKFALDEAAVIAIADQSGIIKKVNANFCKLSKYSEEELIGKDFRIINSAYHSKAFIRNLWETIINGGIWKGEMKNKAKDGTYFWVQTTIVPFLNDLGKPYQYLSIRADITKRKETEEDLLQRTSQLHNANKKLGVQNQEKENRAAELTIANKELEYQNNEKENRAAELAIANEELAYQNQEKENRAAELIIANQELIFQNNEKENRAAELAIANEELAYQNQEKENRAAELIIANQELIFQNNEKEKRATELAIANEELAYQNQEKENRAAELIIANQELVFQNYEKEKRAADLAILSADLTSQQEELSVANSLLIKQEEKVRIINQGLEERVFNRTKELAESEIRFRNMMETIPQIAWTSTLQGKITFYNKRWNDFTGLDKEQTKTVDLKSVIHPDDMQTAIEQYQYINEGNEGVEFQIRGKRADGFYRWHLVRLMPIKNEDGERQLWVGTATDIQELKLIQQQKDDFISIASHELKTPLTVLRASLQLLNRIKEDPSKAMPNLFVLANKSVEKLTVLVKDLLFVSKMNEGQLHITRSCFVLADLISECCNYALEDGVYTIHIQGDKKLEVFADAARIEQIVINFVNNAIKYAAESKEILIDITIVNQMAKVSITDKGPGIPSEKLPHLFDRYYRVDSSGNQYSGLGLGLYISAEIIKKHNGEIGVDSVLGEGSTFWFSLPLI